MTSFRSSIRRDVSIALALALGAACNVVPEHSRIGAYCDGDDQCGGNICVFATCIDPDGDDDLDTLPNALEVELGTDLLRADTDHDGRLDRAELSNDLRLVDSDGDGAPDVRESSLADQDRDCVPDEADRDDVLNDAPFELIARTCRRAGVCAGAPLVVTCDPGSDEATCHYDAVAGFEPDEATCDDRDNDCDGATDEGFAWQGSAVGAPCEAAGACGAGVVECRGATSATCSSGPDGSDSRAAPELCNGLDDDCNGVTDEVIASPVEAGCNFRGVCGAKDAAVVARCEAGAWRCDYGAGPRFEAGRELSCDGLDNDCDGASDEDFDAGGAAIGEPCEGLGACGVGVAECGRDRRGAVCSSDRDGSRSEATAETCNGLDDDCDGLDDEDVDANAAGCVTEGVCAAGVAGACADGAWRCDYGAIATYQPAREATCDGLDNDCDGAVDEDFALAGQPVGGGCVGIGGCGVGVVECAPGGGLRCSSDVGGSAPGASPETCNGRDDDCDGVTDEGLADPVVAGCSSAGVCGEGFDAVTAACREGRWSCDYGAVPGYHGAEVLCDGRDEDCDGATDEGFALGGVVLGGGCDGIGACATGRVECGDDGLAAVCSSNPEGSAAGAQPEQCNGVDDDCDGVIDDGVTPAPSTCSRPGVCDADRGAIVATCTGGAWRCDYGDVAGFEQDRERSCDGRDNDCDGAVDEEFAWGGAAVGASCDGVGRCGRGVVECAGPAAATCSTNPNGLASQALPETCNALDDDCDGLADEGLAGIPGRVECAGTGVCASADQVLASCASGAWTCDYGLVPGYQAGGETACDGLDNDCDGAIDPDCDPPEPPVVDPPEPPDVDADGIADASDNCVVIPNPDQSDENANELGDVCDSCEPFDSCGDALDNDCDGASDASDPQGCALRRFVGVTTDVSGVPAGFTVELGFDHKILVASGLSTRDMYDVRLYHRDPATGYWRQIDVVLQPFAWYGDFEYTRMRFKAQQAIHAHAASGEALNRDYALWIGVPGTGKRDQNGVYHFADIFRRDQGPVVGNGWVETEPTADALGLGNGFGFLEFARPDAGRSVAWHGMPALASGRWVWTTYWRWAHGGGDDDFGVYAQLGDSALGFDAAPPADLYPVAGVGAGVAWARGRWGFGDDGRGGVGVTDGENATLAATDFRGYDDVFSVALDLDARTYGINGDYWGMSAVAEVPFDDPDLTRIDAIRFGADGVDAAAFAERAFGWTMIQMATPAGETDPAAGLGLKEPLGAGAQLGARGAVARWYFDDDRDDPLGLAATRLKDALPEPVDLERLPLYGGPSLAAGEQHGLQFNGTWEGAAAVSLAGTKVVEGGFAIDGATSATLTLVTDTVSANRAFLASIHDGAGSQRLALEWVSYNALGVWVNGARAVTFTNIGDGYDARKVYSVVIDLTAADANDRVRLYRDGVRYTSQSLEAMPAEGTAIDLGDDPTLVLGRSADRYAPDRGRIYFAALHNVALSAAELAADTIILRADDDRR